MTKDRLLLLVADLVEDLLDNGVKKEYIIKRLQYHGFKEEDITDWYGLTND
jgi:hypothetical protein